ncbi:hypothetical protein [Faecalimicrobium dakarense]|uniref:hypothetical protein n=1 Tax=Faecalimicrobium dakarense TaxID=1301100 RepID=UPI0004B75A22|nr:hypothetical protein [[Clostridium] dakarense]
MNFIIDISKYVLGNLQIEDLPLRAEKLLEEGYDTPSLRILAGLDNYPWDIDYYLKLTLEELNIEVPNQKMAGLLLIEHHINQMIKKELDLIDGLKKIIDEVLWNLECFNDEEEKYAYECIGFSELYSLYYAYDEVINCDDEFLVLEKPIEEEIRLIKEKIMIEAIKYNEKLKALF